MSDDKKVIIDEDEIIDEVIASFAIDDMFVYEIKISVKQNIKRHIIPPIKFFSISREISATIEPIVIPVI